MSIVYPYFSEIYDPDEQLDFTFRFLLFPGENIVSAQIDQVDSTSTTILSPPTLTLGPKAIGVISGNLWGISQWITSAVAGNYVTYLRCSIVTDWTLPIPRKITRSMRLSVGQL